MNGQHTLHGSQVLSKSMLEIVVSRARLVCQDHQLLTCLIIHSFSKSNSHTTIVQCSSDTNFVTLRWHAARGHVQISPLTLKPTCSSANLTLLILTLALQDKLAMRRIGSQEQIMLKMLDGNASNQDASPYNANVQATGTLSNSIALKSELAPYWHM